MANIPDTPEFWNALSQGMARNLTVPEIHKRILKLSDIMKQFGHTADPDEFMKAVNMDKAYRTAARLRVIKDIQSQLGKGGSVLGGALQIPLAGMSGYGWGQAMMNQAGSAMGIPQTAAMAQNQDVDTANLMRRRALIQGGQ